MRDSRELPSGIVTFVFTDIEGSTRLFHQLGEHYVEVLERHRRILRGAWAAHHGVEVSTDGDAFFVAFTSAGDAVEACAQAQLGLVGAAWPGGREVRVRMGIHTGLATPYAGDYVALAVHQAARVVAAGHGGQILVSEQAAAEINSTGVFGLRSLGHFRIRDFEKPEKIYEVVGEGLPQDFPAIRAVPADGHNLVRQPTHTVGREEAIAHLVDEIQPRRLTTLVGPGGVGKTRVANEVGVRVASAWEDGVWRVDLAGISESVLVAGAIAEAVGAPARPGGERWTDVLEHMAARQAVILLDNCEHLVDACRDLVASLFSSCDQVGVMATSREPIRVPGENLWPVPPLLLPKQDNPSPEEAFLAPAVQLFVERGAAVRPGFELNDQNTDSVVSICRHLDGLPLSLELAAANLAVLSPNEILTGLEDRFPLLQSRDRGPDDRHRTMEGVLEWSYQMLDPAERTAFRRLSVFGTSFSRATATAAVAVDGIGVSEVAQLLFSLVDRSLVAAELAADDTRYRMLETIQAYGRQRLAEEGETGLVAAAVANHFMDQMGPWHPADQSWVSNVQVELDNLRTLVPLTAGERQEPAQLLACTIGRFHDATHSFRAGIEELGRLVELLPQASAARASLLTTLADLYLRTGDTESANRLVEDADALRREYGMPEWDDVGVDRTRGEIARRSGDLPAAIGIARRALEQDLSDRGKSRIYNLLGTTAGAMGDLDLAHEALTRELELNQRVGYEGYIASAHGNLAEVALRRGAVSDAAHHQRACLELATAQGSLPMVAFSLIIAARVAGFRRDWATAVRLHAKGEALLSEIGLVLYADDREESNRLLGEARQALGQGPFDRAIEEGHGLDTPDGIRLADSVLATAGHE